MRSQALAFLERAFPRFASSLSMVVLAVMTDPLNVGLYAIVTLAYTFQLAITEGASRQIIVRMVTEEAGSHFFQRYRVAAPAVGVLVILITLTATALAGAWPDMGTLALATPIIAAPLANAMGLKAVGTLQVAGAWRSLARNQLVASTVGVLVGVPLVIATQSFFGCVLQAVLQETVFTYLCIVGVAHVEPPRIRSSTGPSLRSDMLHMGVYTGGSWLQGQSERVFIASTAGAQSLGYYTFASALARAAADSLADSSANLLRASLIAPSEAASVRTTAERIINHALLLATLAVLFAIGVSEIVFRPLLGDNWREALDAVPILALLAFPAVLARNAAVLQVAMASARKAVLSPVVGISFAPFIAWLSQDELRLAALLVVAREMAVVTVAFLSVRKASPWRSYYWCWALVLGLGAAVLMIF